MSQAVLAVPSTLINQCRVPRIESTTGRTLQLFMGIGTFCVCFAIFGTMAGMMPIIAPRLGLSEAQIGLALATPVLLGSFGRIVFGMLTDRFGARAVCIGILTFSI